MNKDTIDTNFDFTIDTPHFWDNFWQSNSTIRTFNNDPDSASKTLQHYHYLLWSRQLPNGEFMNLTKGSGANYLSWSNIRFSSDSITTSFRYKNNRKMMELVSNAVTDYKVYVENYLHKCYTIGGAIIFPKRSMGINQSRGINPQIKDRWDLTLECIRRYYNSEQSPLYDVFKKDKAFFDLFVDFRGYVDYFFLQDCVSKSYDSVICWLGDGSFHNNPLPQTLDDYFYWIDRQIEFVSSRNERIANFCLTTQYTE